MIKIEIGSGENPKLGYYHLDIRCGLPSLDCQADIRFMPFKNESIDEIFSMATLQHIKWSYIPQVFNEFKRVLKKGGILKFYVPDLDWLAEQLLKRAIPFETLIPWIFGGQDDHLAGFNKEYISGMLTNQFVIETFTSGNGIYVEARRQSTTPP